MLINKITEGYVVQTFDTEKKQFISQEFIAGYECFYETPNGKIVDVNLLQVDMQEIYLSYNMVQPATDNLSDLKDWVEGELGEYGSNSLNLFEN